MDLSQSSYVESLQRGAKIELRSPVPQENPTGLFVTVLGADAPAMRDRARQIQREQMMSGDLERNWGDYTEIEMSCEAILKFEGGSGSVVTVEDLRKFLRTHADGFFYARQIVRAAERTSSFFGSAPRT